MKEIPEPEEETMINYTSFIIFFNAFTIRNRQSDHFSLSFLSLSHTLVECTCLLCFSQFIYLFIPMSVHWKCISINNLLIFSVCYLLLWKLNISDELFHLLVKAESVFLCLSFIRYSYSQAFWYLSYYISISYLLRYFHFKVFSDSLFAMHVHNPFGLKCFHFNLYMNVDVCPIAKWRVPMEWNGK